MNWNGLIARIEDFLRAMGGLFAFMGSQYPLAVDGEEFLIDLLLFHRRLRCLVVIELKIGKFKPEYVGKMQFYLTALDRQIRQEDENPSIGIILCKEKNRTIVEYALHDARNPIGVATYEITKTLPKELRGNCPNRKRSRHCWRVSVCMACSQRRCDSAPRRLAYAWRWAPRRRGSSD